jgi:hypothetical protein
LSKYSVLNRFVFEYCKNEKSAVMQSRHSEEKKLFFWMVWNGKISSDVELMNQRLFFPMKRSRNRHCGQLLIKDDAHFIPFLHFQTTFIFAPASLRSGNQNGFVSQRLCRQRQKLKAGNPYTEGKGSVRLTSLLKNFFNERKIFLVLRATDLNRLVRGGHVYWMFPFSKDSLLKATVLPQLQENC